MMAKWLNSSRKKKIRDIRSFIPVHGKILKAAITSLSHESSPDAPVSSETLGTHVVAAWTTSGAKQLSLVQLNKKANALAEGRRPKVPASSFSTGIRRKVASTGSTNREEEADTGHGMLEDKENCSDHMLSQTSPPLCHRMNGHKRRLQPRISVNTSTANIDIDKGELSHDKTNSKQLPHTLGVSEPMSTASPPNKRLRTGQYCSSRKSPSHKHSCENYVKVVCSHRKSVDSFELHGIDNQVKPITQGCKQPKSCGSSRDVQIIPTSIDSTGTLQSAEVTHVITLPTNNSNFLLSCTTSACVDNTNIAAEIPVLQLSSRNEEGHLSLLQDSLEEPIYPSQERSRTFLNLDENNIDTDELLAELSNCEKIV